MSGTGGIGKSSGSSTGGAGGMRGGLSNGDGGSSGGGFGGAKTEDIRLSYHSTRKRLLQSERRVILDFSAEIINCSAMIKDLFGE